MKDKQIFVCCWPLKKGNNKKQKEQVNLNAVAKLNTERNVLPFKALSCEFPISLYQTRK